MQILPDVPLLGAASAPYGRVATANAEPFRGIVWHHTAPVPMQNVFEYGQRVDPERGGAFGYHFYVDRDGAVIQGAPGTVRTNHIKPGSPVGLSNANALGISLVGASEGATEAQLEAARDLGNRLSKVYGIEPPNNFGHGEIQGDRMATEGLDVARFMRGDDVADDTMRALGFEPLNKVPPRATGGGGGSLIASQPEATSGPLLGGAASDTLEAPMPQSGLLGIPQNQPEPEPMTFGERLRAGAQSGQLWESLAVAFNGMRTNPSDGPAQMARAGQQRRERAAQEEEQNRRRMQAAQFFEAQGRPDLAQAVMSGVIDGGAAFGAQRQDAQMSQAQAAQAQEAQQQQTQMNRTLAFIDSLPDNDPRKPLAALAAQNGDMGTAMKILQQGAEAAPAAFQTLQARAAAAGLRPGTPEYQQFMLEGSGGQTINLNTGPQGIQYPDPPSGFTYGRNPDGTIALTETQMPGGGTTRVPQLVPLPGSAADREAQTNAAQQEERGRQERLRMGGTMELVHLNIKEIEDGGLPVTGPIGELRQTRFGRMVTGNDAMDVQNRTNAITDNAALAEIVAMKEKGQGVGQLTENERKSIGNAVTALSTATSRDEYLRAAKAYRELALNIAFGEGNWRLDEKTGEVSYTPTTGAARTAPQASAPQQGSRLRYNPATGEFE